jgi:hypothetical protein
VHDRGHQVLPAPHLQVRLLPLVLPAAHLLVRLLPLVLLPVVLPHPT